MAQHIAWWASQGGTVADVIRGARVCFVDDASTDGGQAVTDYDVVEILDSGALRVAQLWQGETWLGWCEIETAAAYYPAGSWKHVTPLQQAGTLFVEDEEDSAATSRAVERSIGPVSRLGTRVTPDAAHRLAVDYLVENYDVDPADADNDVRENLPTRGRITVTQPETHFDSATKRDVRFIFWNTAPEQPEGLSEG